MGSNNTTGVVWVSMSCGERWKHMYCCNSRNLGCVHPPSPLGLANDEGDGSFLFALAAISSRPEECAMSIYYFGRVVRLSECASCHQSSERVLYMLHCVSKVLHVNHLFVLS